MTVAQEFYLSVTPIWGNEYLVRTERVAPGVPLAEEQVTWAVDDWLAQASRLMKDPLQGLLRGEGLSAWAHAGAGGAGEQTNTLVALGQHLYNALFQGTIRDSWMTAQGIAKHRHEELRLRLGLKDQRLPRLPWEVLHNGDRSLATGTDVVFSRFHSGLITLIPPALLQHSLESKQPLKILMVLSAPTDQEVLALKQEALHLQEELQRTTRTGGRSQPFSEVVLNLLEQPGREQLTQSLEHEHYHVFHYAGHSDTGQSGGNLYLVSSKTGLTETLSGDDLAGLLVNNGIRLAVLNSCRGVYTATDGTGETDQGNLAEALIKRGVPAVLAMAERIPDDVALTLSRLFYRNLKQGYAIDLSLSRTRQGLVSSYSSHQFYWALPILYLHSAFDGYLLPSSNTDSSPFSTPFLTTTIAPNPPITDSSISSNTVDDLLPDTVLEPYGEALPETLLDFYDDSPNLWQTEADPDSEALELEDLELESTSGGHDLNPVARLVEQLRATPTPTLPPVATVVGTSTATTVTAQPKTYEINSETIQTYSALEQLLAETGKLTEEIATCSRALQQNPNSAQAYNNLGWALQKEGYISEAIAVYTQALHIDPLLAGAYHHLGLAFYQKGNFQDAIQYFQRALKINPDLVEAQHHLGIALQRQGGGLSLPLNIASQAVYPLTQPFSVAGIASDHGNVAGISTSPIYPVPSTDAPVDRAPNWLKFLIILGGISAILITGLWLGTKWTQPKNSSSARPEVAPALSVTVSAREEQA